MTKSKKGSKQTSAQTSQTARDVPAPWSPFPSAQRAERAVTCELCNTVVPVEASNCPGCGSTLAVTIAAPALAEQPPSPRRAPDAHLPGRAILYGVIAGAAVIAVVAAVVVFLMRH